MLTDAVSAAKAADVAILALGIDGDICEKAVTDGH